MTDKPPSNLFFAAWFAFCAIVGLIVLGVGIWAVIQLVQWVTAQ